MKVVKFLTDNGFQDASLDYEVVADWSVRWPNCGWAIPTGPDTFWALDVDGEEGLAELAEILETPDTVTIATPSGGKHFYFDWPDGFAIRNSASRLAPGVDVRGEGGCVFVPPTLGYELVHNGNPAAAPTKLVKRLLSPPSENVEVVKKEIQPIPAGRRNTTLASIGGAMRRYGSSHNSIVSALHFENTERCNPPLPPAEVDAIAASIMRYEPTADAPDDWTGQALDLSLIRERPQEREQLIEDFLEVERLMLLFGPPGDFKTILATDAAVAVASGRSWLADATGRGLMTVQSPVIMVQQDQGAKDTVDRLHALFNGYDVPSSIPLYVYAFPRPGLDLIRNYELLGETIQRHGARFVVADNLFNIAGVREENSSEIGLGIRNLAELRDLTGAHILLIHHPTKATGWSRGHGVILQNVDQSIKVVRDEEYVSFEVEKERGAGITSNLVARFEYEHYPNSRMMKSARFRRASSDEYEIKELGETAELIRSYVGENPGRNKTHMYSAIGGDRNKLWRACSMMLSSEQLVIGPGKGRGDHVYLPEDVPTE